MVDRGVGKTEEGLLRHGPLQFAGLKQIRREPVGVVAADGTEDQIDLRVPERLQQILRPPFRMRTQRLEPRAGMGQEPDLQAVVLQARKAEPDLMLHKRLTQDPARQADDPDCPDHTPSLPCILLLYMVSVPRPVCKPFLRTSRKIPGNFAASGMLADFRLLWYNAFTKNEMR